MTDQIIVMPSKRCSQCNKSQLLDKFYKDKTGALGRSSKCKKCFLDRCKNYYAANKSTIRINRATYKLANLEKDKLQDKRYYQAAKKTIRAYYNNRYKTDPAYRQYKLCRARFRSWFKSKGCKMTGHVADLIGCTWNELVAHLKSKFKLGMTLENQGSMWHIDHILPLKMFDPLNIDDCRRAWNFTNLQPLWSADNLSKGCKHE